MAETKVISPTGYQPPVPLRGEKANYFESLRQLGVMALPLVQPIREQYLLPSDAPSTPVEVFVRIPTINNWNMEYRRLQWPNTDQMRRLAIPLDEGNIIWQDVPQGWIPVKRED